MRLLAGALVLGTIVGLCLAFALSQKASPHDRLLFAAHFGERGLVTNEWAHYNPAANGIRSPEWEMTSGSLFARDGFGWSGPIDSGTPDRLSRGATDSAVFRLVSRQAFDNYAVRFSFRTLGFTTTPRTPAHAWDGLHLWLRYQSAQKLYFASFARRDGHVVIGKKYPGGSANGGRYEHLSTSPTVKLAPHAWHHLHAAIETTGGTVTIRLLLDGKLVARAVDRDGQDPPIVRPGRVGLRADNAEFEFRRFEVRTL
jgi:3-keto-disaccharide hydrolase